MSEISISQLKDSLSEYVNRAAYARERIIILSRGKPKAVVISLEDLERLEELEDALAAAEALDAYNAGETIPWEQVRVQLAEAGSGLSN
jgi:prevent-host-death family protein